MFTASQSDGKTYLGETKIKYFERNELSASFHKFSEMSIKKYRRLNSFSTLKHLPFICASEAKSHFLSTLSYMENSDGKSSVFH